MLSKPVRSHGIKQRVKKGISVDEPDGMMRKPIREDADELNRLSAGWITNWILNECGVMPI